MKLLISIFFVCALFPLIADEEVSLMQDLVCATEKNLQAQKKLLTAIMKFKHKKAEFLEGSDSAKLATDLVRYAMFIQKKIENEHLAHLFSSDFLDEIQLYNQLGKQQKP